MSNNLDKLRTAANALIAEESPLTPDRIRTIIKDFRTLYSDVTDSEAECLAQEFETQHDVTMQFGEILVGDEHEPWFNARRADIDFYYWRRYKRLLVEKKRFSSHVVDNLDRETDRILDFLGDPDRTDPWDRRGLVFGHVQSGKTANYTGLISKAADAGYKFIVIIAGLHNNLRHQTQSRIDEGFIGQDSTSPLSQSVQRYIGVGKYDSTQIPVSLTGSHRDFNRMTASSVMGMSLRNFNVPVVCVIKKNFHTLQNLTEWLKETSTGATQGLVHEPMLLVDDEADNASINICYGQEKVSTINRQIRRLLQLFVRSCYVGFTATPFANIFIDPDTEDKMLQDDLFPRHFIVSLEPPSNYFGANQVFLQKSNRIVKHITDNEDCLPLKHTKNWEVIGIPPSLTEAIRTFVVARALRLVRGHGTHHCSMLVNASRFNNVQRQLRNKIQSTVECIQHSTRIYGCLPPDQVNDLEMEALKQIWKDVYTHTEDIPDWPTVQQHLYQAAAPIQVIEVNSTANEPLNYAAYRNGLSVIAVGGYSLSRGMTLEGLMISYFLRSSMMYDTLMQMGRWFGYRDGYYDLCRIWMPEEAEGWYEHISDSIEELREELRLMAVQGATPREFGLKVRSHPDTLIVTARNKMGSGQSITLKIGLANRFCETAILKRDPSSLETNRQAVRHLVKRLEAAGHHLSKEKKDSHGWLLTGTPVTLIMDFISEFQNHPDSNLTDPSSVRQYIRERSKKELQTWDILFASLKQESELQDHSLGIKINCQTRTPGNRSDANTIHVTNKQRVASRGVEKVGLSPDIVKEAEHRYRQSRGSTNDRNNTNYPDRIYRAERKRPLLIIHLLKIKSEPGGIEHEKPIIAWSLSFPQTKMEEERVEYVVNTSWWHEHYPVAIDEETSDNDI